MKGGVACRGNKRLQTEKFNWNITVLKKLAERVIK